VGDSEVRTHLLATLILAAAARAADVAGHYRLQNMREMGSELLLKPDGQFEFFLAYGAADYWAKGKWQNQNGTVVLSSNSEPKPPFRILTSSAVKTEGVRVIVTAAGGRPVPNIDVLLDGAEARTDSDGVAHFAPTKGLKSVQFRIRVYQFESDLIALNPAHNEFRFEIDGREITQVRFNNESLAVNGNSLVLRHFGGDQPLRYTKD
jgi:hypothetical protein